MLVTHDERLAERCDQRFSMTAGELLGRETGAYLEVACKRMAQRELGILLMALVLLCQWWWVSVVSSPGYSQRYCLKARFLAADMVVVSRSPIPEPWVSAAQEQQLQPTEVVGFPLWLWPTSITWHCHRSRRCHPIPAAG